MATNFEFFRDWVTAVKVKDHPVEGVHAKLTKVTPKELLDLRQAGSLHTMLMAAVDGLPLGDVPERLLVIDAILNSAPNTASAAGLSNTSGLSYMLNAHTSEKPPRDALSIAAGQRPLDVVKNHTQRQIVMRLAYEMQQQGLTPDPKVLERALGSNAQEQIASFNVSNPRKPTIVASKPSTQVAAAVGTPVPPPPR